ncbi:MAG: phage shock protein PspA [Desulfuromusa sp.]|nr:phage shock protein PspA [Desulfuromusa sp.]
MSIFSRFNDIIHSNINAMLEQAEDPEKIIRLVIQEMEDTMVEVRTNAAKTIADQKTLRRQLERLQHESIQWGQKAELAINKDREDLARAALAEKNRIQTAVEQLEKEAVIVEEQLDGLNSDIGQLQAKLSEAKTRKKSLDLRWKTANSRLKVRDKLSDGRVDDAMLQFEHLERKMDTLEGRVEAHDLGQEKTLEEEFAELAAEDTIEQELAELKKRLDKDSAEEANLDEES